MDEGLSVGSMKIDAHVSAVQRMQDYIETHLYEEITLASLARASLFSPFYSHRLFTQMTGCTPFEYVRRLRLARSALALRDGSDGVADVAFQMGFGSVDGYQRAFFREFGCNPGAFAANPTPVYLFTSYGVKYRAIRGRKKMSDTRTVFVREVQKPARKVLVKRGREATDYFDYCDEVGCDIWGLLVSMCGPGEEPVCLWLPRNLRAGGSEYVQGVEVPSDYAGPVPAGLDLVELPAARYLQFTGEPYPEEEYETAIREMWEAIARYDPAQVGLAWDESNPRIQLEPRGARGYIELVAVV